MKTLRLSTFETNSSSCHSLVIIPKEVFKKFKDGNVFLNAPNGIRSDWEGEEIVGVKTTVEEYLNVEQAVDLILKTDIGKKPSKGLGLGDWQAKFDFQEELKNMPKKDIPDFLRCNYSLGHFGLTTYSNLKGWNDITFKHTEKEDTVELYMEGSC